MLNYICLECSMLFDEPDRWEERHGLSTPPYEEFTGCPHCHGAYDEAVECERCGAIIPKNDAYDDEQGHYMCDACMDLALGNHSY